MSDRLSTVDEAIDAIAQGQVIIVMDDEERENEGDFICAAEKVTNETVNFMITHGRGQLCMPLLPETCQRLDLQPMVAENTAPLGTAFTVPVDHRNCRTGITAPERAMTIRAIVDPESKPGDFVRPGHLFPLIAKEGGVLRRAGHTESAVDLTRLAGLQPAGVLCEILAEGGDRASREELYALAARFNLKIITVGQLIRYRRRSEKLVYRMAQADLPTKVGPARIHAYGVQYESQEPVAIVWGDPTKSAAPLVRLHSACFTGDLLDSLRCDCGDQLRLAMEMIGNEGSGVLVYLP
ncbi:MAG: 3,4-dihydroxy-2-butanone-4-phosphate synthase, partial [Pirellulaceae bacterium]|nr:3,4-dihydroxy-2-butanone-4-phosphate synthase [Pirellulaceae bacterium]